MRKFVNTARKHKKLFSVFSVALLTIFSAILCLSTDISEAQASTTIKVVVDDYGKYTNTNNDQFIVLEQGKDYQIGQPINKEPKEYLINGRTPLKELAINKQNEGYTLVWYDQANKPFYWVRTPSTTSPDGSYNPSNVNNMTTMLHGKWEKRLCTVAFSDGYGQAKSVAKFVQNGTSIQQAINNKAFTLRTPTRSGYTFLGWHDQSDSNDSSIYDLNAPVNKAVKLVALWKLTDSQQATLDDPDDFEKVPDTITGTCWIGSNWDYVKAHKDPGDPYDGWPGTHFTLTDFSGYLAGCSGVGNCISPTAAAACNTMATYKATLRSVDYESGEVIYDVVVYPPNATNESDRDWHGMLTGYQIVGFEAVVHKNFGGWIDIQKFSANENVTDGNPMYSLAGAEFGIYKDEACTVRATTTSGEAPILVTDDNGYAKSALLPIGTYYVKELKAPTGYALSDESPHAVVVKSNKTTRDEEYDKPQGDISLNVQKADGESNSSTAQGGASLEGAVFAVRYYSVSDPADKSNAAVKKTWYIVTDGTGKADLASIEPGKREFIYLINNHGYTLELTSDEIANEGGKPIVPLGIVEVQEVLPPSGYLLDNGLEIKNGSQLGKILGTTRTYKITGDRTSVEIDMKTVSQETQDKIVRANFYMKKTAAGSNIPLAGVPFMIELVGPDDQVIERHLAVTDNNGVINTSNDWNQHSNLTNENDKYFTGTDAETYKITDESKLDPNAGVFFTGYKHGSNEANKLLGDQNNMDARGSFPYGRYHVIELRCSSNIGYSLVNYSYDVTRNDTVGPGNTVQDQPIKIKTIATDDTTGDHLGLANPKNETTILNDTVSYSGLIPGKTYKMTGTLMDKSAGTELLDETGSKITSTVEFTADDSGEGSVIVPFNVPTQALVGKTTVVFESLIENGTEAASHADIKDEGQTVYYPELHTTATDSITGEHEGSSANEKVTINDEIQYSGLKLGNEYKLSGTLMDKATGEPIKDSSGNVITAEKNFKPSETNGSETITFEVASNLVAGKTIVVFENLYSNNILVGVHADLGDAGQSVFYPFVRTVATDGVTGGHEGLADGKIVLNDVVSYENLTKGETYTVSGTLMDKATGEPIKDQNGNEITSTTTFTAGENNQNNTNNNGDTNKTDADQLPQRVSGDVTVTFEFDAALVKGKQIVVFENLYRGENDFSIKANIARHADINDDGQEVSYPEIHTTATVNGEHRTYIEDDMSEIELVDVIEYKNLCPGATYKISGTLKNKANGSDITDGVTGQVVTTSYEFVPETANGTANVTFKFNISGTFMNQIVAKPGLIPGTSEENVSLDTVVFENIYRVAGNNETDKLIAQHADLTDDKQTVSFEKAATNDDLIATGDALPKVGIAFASVAALVGLSLFIARRKKK